MTAEPVRRVLVLGGYGGFGGRISRRLAGQGLEVLVAGRSFAKAEAFCRGDPHLIPVELERSDIVAALSQHAPDLLVDASGPFQAMDLTIPRACIAAGVHYCDIADSRAFVTAVPELDAAARKRGVVLISGASSVPALSGAVVRELSTGLDRVTAVEIAISASNRAAAGPAVAAAILGQVGKPFRARRSGREDIAYGWQEPIRIDFEVAGLRPLRGRRVALVDVPDFALMPDSLPGTPSVIFRAGTELDFQNVALGLLSWPVRWGWLGSLAGLARWIAPMQRLTARLGSDRSAMRLRLFGLDGNQRLERRWTLIAEHGDGPEIPALAVPPLAARILAGAEPPGARDAGQALRLADFQDAFAGLAIAHATSERTLRPPLYARVMGSRFAELPQALRRIHEVLRDGGASGEAEVTGPANPLGKLVARIMRFPVGGRYPLHVSFSERDGGEHWTRHFGARAFASSLEEADDCLVERFGPLRFRFDLPSDHRGLEMRMVGWSAWRVPLPLFLAPRSRAQEWEEDGRFCFDVPIALPLIGRIVHYRGWLTAS
ncbi:DUF4166 domain-containing protein [Novosphingobium sp. JCM 18896]|uniref:DUF4166 domain-containing protein n=1 Tax=Novosphingobium sp. JCM 18896 TaxID=2989731 RepID=UPI002222F65C|nr:DUF4166 domain-containing protein [Novosphingobium sp. JCM 18896]MCW1430786.1 DUF4166 domain-containing protein [Novosphingobium sp. JCM 18896]